MTEPRDSLRDVLGAHLDRARADAEAERKAAAMLERPALQARLDDVAALGDEARNGEVASERSEHAVVSPSSAATPDRSTQRKVAIDPRFDPRLLETQVKAAGRSRKGPTFVIVGVLGALAVGAWWLLGSSATFRGDSPEATPTVPVPLSPPTAETTAAPSVPPTAAGPAPLAAPDVSASPLMTTAPEQSASNVPSTPPPPTKPTPSTSAAAKPPGSVVTPPAATSGYKPLGGNGPVF